MKISNNGIALPQRQNNTIPAFKSSKFVQTVSNNTSKLASAAVTAVGVAALAINKNKVTLRTIDTVPDGANLDYDVVKDMFEECYNSDFSVKNKLLEETLKKVATAKGKDTASEIVVNLIRAFGNLDDITQRYPEFTEFFVGTIAKDVFLDNDIQKDMLDAIQKNAIKPYLLDDYEKFLKAGYILDKENDYTELHNKAYYLDLLDRSSAESKFDSYSYINRNKILSTMTYLSSMDENLTELFGAAVDILPEEKIEYICDNPAEIKPLFDNFVDNITNISFNLLSKVDEAEGVEILAAKIAFMKDLYPENFEKLVNSQIFKEIKAGTISLEAIKDLDISKIPDDRYLKTLVADFEQKARDGINLIPHIDKLSSTKQMLQDLQFNTNELEKIANSVQNAKDQGFVIDILEKMPLFITSDKEKDKDFIIHLIDFCEREPQVIKKIINLNGYDQETIAGSMALFNRIKDVSVIERLIQKGVDKEIASGIINHITKKNIIALERYLDSTSQVDLKQLAKLLVIKHFTILDDPIKCKRIIDEFSVLTKDFDENFEEDKFIQYFNDIALLVPLLDMKMHAPKTFEKIKQSGFFELCKTEDFGIKYVRKLNSNSDLSENVYDDLKKLKSGEDIVLSFKTGTSIQDVFNQTKCGDVVEIGEKLYINDGSSLIEWKMSKQRYLDLFPPVKRFINLQNGIGNCYFVSSISSMMENPKTRVELYKSFEQDGEDTLVTIKAYEDYKGTVRLEKSELPYKKKKEYLTGCKGMQFLEYAYGETAVRADGIPVDKKRYQPDDIVKRTAAGKIHVAMSELLGLEMVNPNFDIPGDLSKASFEHIPTNYDKDELEKIFDTYVNDKNYIVHFSTNDIFENKEARLSLKHNINSEHAHHIAGYDKNTGMVKIINPHHSGITTLIHISKMPNLIDSLTITSLS